MNLEDTFQQATEVAREFNINTIEVNCTLLFDTPYFTLSIIMNVKTISETGASESLRFLSAAVELQLPIHHRELTALGLYPLYTA